MDLENIPQIVLEPVQKNLTVKIQINNNNSQTIAQVYSNDLTIGNVKQDLSEKFKINVNYLRIEQRISSAPLTKDSAAVVVVEINDNKKLYQLERNEYDIIELKLFLNESDDTKKLSLDTETFYNSYQLPEFISVHIASENDPNVIEKKLVVEIINQPIKKYFLGGYINKKTSIEYHDAFTQTGPSMAPASKYDSLVTRVTQTLEVLNKSVDTYNDHSTQSFGSATELIYIPSATDYYIDPKKYQTHDEIVKRINKLGKICLIQRNFRRYLWQKLIKRSAAQWRRLVEEQNQIEYLRKEKIKNGFITECITKTIPKSREEFNVLCVQVQKWKENEIKKINELYSGGPRLAELNILLDKEIQLLNAIERKLSISKKYLTIKKSEERLEEMGAPIKWIGYKDIVCEMDSLRTQKIRKLTKLYHKMKKTTLKDKRLELIENIMQLIQNEEKNKNLDELKELLLREKNLITCNIQTTILETLRQRELLLFMDFIFEHKKVDQKTTMKNILCKQCKNVKSITEFQLYTRQSEINTCKSCAMLKVPAVDITIYRAILRSIQRDERKRNALGSYAFIIKEEDIRKLLENIWHGHSILSQCNIRAELRLPRWHIDKDWSPWNCVCLTEPERLAHIRIKHFDKLYDEYILKDISKKQELAKLAFKKLKDVNLNFVESGEWWQIGLNDKLV